VRRVRRRFLLTTACAVAALSSLPCAAEEPDPVPDVYLLAGQSNMSGRGSIQELTAAERTPDPAVSLYGNDGKRRAALDPLDDATGQVDAVSADPQAGVGPGLTFARQLRKVRKRPIALVPCAKGGSAIRRWRPGGGRDTLYGSCVARAREAGAPISGILWYQGETDAEAEERAAEWKPKFAELVGQLRRDLGSNRLPVVFIQLADRPARPDRPTAFPGWETVQGAQAQFRMRCTAMVSAKGLARKEDDLHLTTAAQRELGARMAAAMHMLLKRGCK
jgi:Carbohydrate esterase, sialic acid-specific acetylesterase